MEQYAVLFALACAVAAVAYGLISAQWILGLPQGSDRMRQIAAAVQEGAGAYMKRQYTIIAVVGAVMFVALFASLGAKTAIGFAIGALFSGLTGFIGMFVSVRANIRTTEAAKFFGQVTILAIILNAATAPEGRQVIGVDPNNPARNVGRCAVSVLLLHKFGDVLRNNRQSCDDRPGIHTQEVVNKHHLKKTLPTPGGTDGNG